MERSDICYVDRKLYPHLFLFPAVVVVTVLAFLNKRRSFKKDLWGGRPGVVIPLDFLGVDHDRFAISTIFGATAELIMEVILRQFTSDGSIWSKALSIPGYALEVAFLCYPFFACITTKHKLVGSIMGILYTLCWSITTLFHAFDKCQDSVLHEIEIFSNIPIIMCFLFVLGKYVIVLYHEGRKLVSWTTDNNQENNFPSKIHFAKPWVLQYVRDLLKPRFSMLEKKWFQYLRKIYSPQPNFHFSTQTISIVLVCLICLYEFTVRMIYVGRLRIKSKLDTRKIRDPCITNIVNALGGCLITSTVLVALVCVFSVVRFMDCHKNNMLRLFKGDKTFIPAGWTQSQFMVGRCLKYPGFQIAYFLWGMLLMLLVFLIFTLAFAVIIYCDWIRNWLWNKIVYLIPATVVTLLVWALLIASSMTIFRDDSFAKNTITLDNRNVYLVFSYFYFFLGLPIGLLSSASRVIKAMVVGFFMLPRIDHSVMADGFQKFDMGFAAYICYIHVQTAHRNPVLRVFCQTVHNLICKPDDGTVKTTKRFRNKWFLLVTLIRNTQLRAFRKHVIAPPTVKFVNSNDVSLEIPKVEIKL